MKIAFISQPWTLASPDLGSDSIEILTYNFARNLAKSHEVIFYGKKPTSHKEVEYCVEGIRYRGITSNVLDWIFRPRRILYRLGLLDTKCPYFASKLFHLGYIYKIANDLKTEHFDIVHILNFSQFVPVIRAMNPKVKICLHMECNWLSQLDRKLIEQRLRKSDLIIGCSQYITNKVCNRFPQFAARCRTVYNGVDIDHFFVNDSDNKFNKHSNTRTLLYVGRVSPEKGIHVLIDAFEKVVSQYPQTVLKIVGPEAVVAKEMMDPSGSESNTRDMASFYQGSYRSHLQKRLSSKTVKSVLFTGSVKHSKLITHYQKSDIFIFPSVWQEPFGIPVIEAMAAEIPVIATRGGAFPEIVEEGKTGLLVEQGNSAALAEAIIHLLADGNRRKAMGKAGRQRVLEKFHWPEVTRILESNYQEIS
jgi:glycosyltransferase involved in cell wall biosynthesis